MQFSGKITNSVLVYLSRAGWERERLFELSDLSYEFLRDPSSWMNANEVEGFLRAVEREFDGQDPQLLQKVGHQGHELRAWGVLDSVLRMMQKPQDIFAQPHRFLSYFISPAPPIGNLERTDEAVSFDLPISNQEYPLVTTYLSAALEGLPCYLGKELAQANWRQTKIRISWSDSQVSLLNEVDSQVNPKPELVNNLVENFELIQTRLEESQQELIRLELENKTLRQQLSDFSSRRSDPSSISSVAQDQLKLHLHEAREAVVKLTDYLTRTHQAMTVARASNRNDPHFIEALRRIDWENIRIQYPWLHMQALESLQAAEQSLEKKPTADQKSPKAVPVSFLLDRVMETLKQETPAGLEIRHLSFIEKPVKVDAEKMQLALHQLLSAAAREIEYRGQIQIVSRLQDDQVEIRIVPSRDGAKRKGRVADLPLLNEEVDRPPSSLDAAVQILQQHHGQLKVQGRIRQDRAYVCHWPMQ